MQAVKDKYHRLERKIEKGYKWIAAVFALPMILVYIKVLSTDEYDVVNICVMWLIGLFFVLWLYTETSVKLMYVMYRHHRLEFRHHIKSMLIMHLVTIGCIISLITGQVTMLYANLCLQHNSDGAMYDP